VQSSEFRQKKKLPSRQLGRIMKKKFYRKDFAFLYDVTIQETVTEFVTRNRTFRDQIVNICDGKPI
jgi:hypothetical protein